MVAFVALVPSVAVAKSAAAKPSAETASAAKSASGPAVTEAKRLFERYVSLEQAFDPAAADLYADEAVIQNRRKYPDGQVRAMSMPAPKYKAMIRAMMPTAKSRNDRNKYTDVRYTPEGDGVRITATRFSELKKYSSPVSILAKADGQGRWLIYEELSESQP